MSVSAEMKYVGTIDGKKVYWAEPGEFTQPGIYFWDGEKNVHVPMTDLPGQILSNKAIAAGWRAKADTLLKHGEMRDGGRALGMQECAAELESGIALVEGEQPTLGDWDVTNRGFSMVEFTDGNGQKCSMQTSSAMDFSHCDGLSDEEAANCYSRPMLWLGVKEINAQIMAHDAIRLGIDNKGRSMGWIDYDIPKEVLLSSRMHLRIPQIKALIADLQRWLREEGEE